MKSIIKKLKTEKNKLAVEIRKMKTTRKDHSDGYVPGLDTASHSYRIKHIADCLLRGRTPQQIESKHRESTIHSTKWAWESAQEIVDAAKEEALKNEVICASA